MQRQLVLQFNGRMWVRPAHVTTGKATDSFPSDVHSVRTSFKGTNPALKKPSNIPEIYAKMFGRFH